MLSRLASKVALLRHDDRQPCDKVSVLVQSPAPGVKLQMQLQRGVGWQGSPQREDPEPLLKRPWGDDHAESERAPQAVLQLTGLRGVWCSGVL